MGAAMNSEKIPTALLWCAIINYALLMIWFVLFTVTHDSFYALTGQWYGLSVDQYNVLMYGGMMVFKLGIILFNLVPYVALRIVGWSRTG